MDISFLLQLLVNKLENILDQDFDIEKFFFINGKPSCSIGWATTIPEWNNAGLSAVGSTVLIGGRSVNPGSFSDFLGITKEKCLDIFFGKPLAVRQQSRLETIEKIKGLIPKNQTWINKLGTDQSDCEVQGRLIVRLEGLTAKVLQVFQSFEEAKVAFESWTNQIEICKVHRLITLACHMKDETLYQINGKQVKIISISRYSKGKEIYRIEWVHLYGQGTSYLRCQ